MYHKTFCSGETFFSMDGQELITLLVKFETSKILVGVFGVVL